VAVPSSKDFVRSPFFYVGDKYKLMPQISPLFPKEFERLIEPFVGGGSVFLNTECKAVLANDLNSDVIDIHQLLQSRGKDMESFIEELVEIAREYDLTCTYKGDLVPKEILDQYPKTYFAHLNRAGFNKLKTKYNESSERDAFKLYALMIYGFNRMLRFNRKGEFNIPVGNVDFNLNVATALLAYAQKSLNREIHFSNLTFEDFLRGIKYKKGDFIYLDPPYLITASEYNKGWDEANENSLYALLDELSEKGVKFALSNVEIYGNKQNTILENWMKKYYVNVIRSNYINYFDNGKKSLREVLVCNYEQA
jgi:DNA adenine methylase